MNDDLHSFIEPELEARIVALVLGEVSAFEKEELERIMDERPEIGLWKRRIEAVHGLVGEAAQPASDKEWKLSSERRAKVFSVIRQGEAPEKTADEVKKIGISRAQRRAILSIAACVMISLLFLAGMKSTIGQKDAQPDLALYSEGIKAEEQSQAWYDSRVAHEASEGVLNLSLLPSEPQKGKGRSAVRELAAIDEALGRDFYGSSGGGGQNEGSPDLLDFTTHKKFRQIAEKNEKFRGPEEGELYWSMPSIPEPPLPEAPTSRMAVVVPKKRSTAEVNERVKQLELQKLAQNVDKQNRDHYAFYVDNESSEAQFENLEESKKSAPADDFIKESEVPKLANLPASGRLFRRSVHHGWDAETEERAPALELGDTFGDDADADGFVGKDAFDNRLGIKAKPQIAGGIVVEGESINGVSQDRVLTRELPASPGQDAGARFANAKEEARIAKKIRGVAKLEITSQGEWRSRFTGASVEGELAARPNGTSDAIALGIEPSKGLKTDAESTGINSVSTGFGVFDDGQLAGDLLPGAAETRHDVNGDGVVAGKPSSSVNDNFSTLNRKAPQRTEEETDRLATSFHRIHKSPEFQNEPLGTAGIVTEGLRSGDAVITGESIEGILNNPNRPVEVPNMALFDMPQAEEEWEDSRNGKFGNELQELENGRDRKRAEMLAQVDQAWGKSLPNAFPESAPTPQGVASKLDDIILPELDLQNTSVEEAIARVTKLAAQNDRTGYGGVDLKLSSLPSFDDSISKDFGSDLAGDSPKIDQLHLKEVPLGVALQYIADKAKLRYRVDESGVTFLPLSSADGEDILTRSWTVPEGFGEFLTNSGGGDDPFPESRDGLSIQKQLQGQGINFPEISKASLIDGRLIVRNTSTQLDLVEQIVRVSFEVQKKKEEKKRQLELKRKTFETSTAEKTDSTFSLNVSDVSFKLAKASLAQGKWPNADKVRSEEFVNALDYGDQKPTQAEKVACAIEQGAHPFMQQRNFMRVSLSTAALGRNASTPLRLTILLDQSGSMERHDRAESVRRAFDLLAAQLTPADEVTLVGFARTSRLLAERVKGSDCGKLSQIVAATPTEGGTNLENALGTGLRLAKQQFLKNAQNRIILLTDGAANLGDALPENLARQVEQMRHAGVSFDACGVGADGLNDEILSSLTKQGDGRYYFLDRPEDADAGFARQIAGALRPAARNVKVQIIFNPDRVSKFHLYGFEKHRLKKEDFRNDAVDAAEMAAEESGVALYHFETLPEGEGDVGMASIRFQDTATGKMVERTWRIPYEPQITAFDQSSSKLRLAGVAGLFGERLKQTPVGERVNLKELRREVDRLQPQFGNQLRFQELRQMLQQAGN